MHQVGIVRLLHGDVATLQVDPRCLQPLRDGAAQDVLTLDEHHLRVRLYLAGGIGQTAHQGGAHRGLVELTQHGGGQADSDSLLHMVVGGTIAYCVVDAIKCIKASGES